MPIIKTKTTYLEMLSPPEGSGPAPRDDIEIARAAQPSVEAYRGWYCAVGGELNWVDRLVMPDDELCIILHDERVEIFLLHVAGETAGYVELDGRVAGDIEIAYYGLFPQFVGQGLGRYFLRWAVQHAWTQQPHRVWLHTCDLDHPAALPNYLKAGFKVYDEQVIEQVVPD
jgi:GNAT superfamily N-acetyltransferase